MTSIECMTNVALPFLRWLITPANVGGGSAGSSPIDFEISEST